MVIKRMKFQGNMGSFNKGIVVLANMVAFIAAFQAVDMSMVEEVEVSGEVMPPRDVVLPHITVTDEMKVGKFINELRIDHSKIKPKQIVQSIYSWDPYILRYSEQYSVDPDLVRAIIYAESKGDPYSVSKDGAMGLMQIMPSTADHMDVSDIFDPEENIKAGVKYIAWLDKHYDEIHVLWAWNAGPEMIRKQCMPAETKKFIVEVLSIKTFLKDDKNRAI